MLKWLLAPLGLFLCLNSEAATKWSTDGGAGDGTGSSLANACNQPCSASAGDTVYLCGAWDTIAFTQSGTSGNNIIYDGSCSGGTPATVTATSTTNALTFTTVSGSRYITVKNVTVSSADAHAIYIDGDDDITLDTITCTGTGGTDRSCVSLLGSTANERITVTNSSLSGATYYGISYQVTGASLTIGGSTFTNNSIFDNDAGCIRLSIESAAYATSSWGGTTTITGNNCYNNAKNENGAGIWMRTGDPSAAPTVFSTGMTISNNTVTDLGSASYGVNGINCGNCDGAIIDGNTVTDSYVAGAGISLLGAKNSTVSDNIIQRISSNNSIDGGGIFADLYSDSNMFLRNFVSDCETSGNNNNSGQAFAMFSAASNTWIGNVAVNCKVGFAWSGTRTDLNKIYNNTVYNASVAGLGVGTVSPTNAATAIDFRNNGVHTAGKCIISFATPLTNANYNGCYSAPYDATQSAGANDTTSDPQLAAGDFASAPDFRLMGAAWRRTGQDLNLGNYQDAGNRAFSHPPSIGAWEATSGDIATARTAASARTARQ